ncbi:MAG: hypothetical protein ABJG78_14490 [Cyclobacteriaceae bacterium]
MKEIKNDVVMVLLLIGGISIIYFFPGKDSRTIHPMTNELAVQPDHMLTRAMQHIAEDDKKVSIEYMEKAIESMRLLESDAGKESEQVIEAAIRDIVLLEEELAAKHSNEGRVKQAFLNALNSLALAQLKESEIYIRQHNYAASKIAMKYATEHLRCAELFSNQDELVKENSFKNSVSMIAMDESSSDEKLIARLDKLITEMDAVVLH